MRLQKAEDKINEKKAKVKLEKLWNVDLYENPDFYHADWQAMRKEKHLALLEYKKSFKTIEEISQEHEGFRIGVNKFQFAYPICKLGSQNFYFIVEFPEGMLQHKFRAEENFYPMSRFFKSRNGGSDRQPCYVIPWDLFEEVNSAEFDSANI